MAKLTEKEISRVLGGKSLSDKQRQGYRKTLEENGIKLEGQKRHGKFNAKKVEIDGIVFDSGLEAKRYQKLKLLERSGEIRELDIHVPYRLEVNGEHICDYEADFVYIRVSDGFKVVEDAKGVKTPVYRLKKKLMKAIYGIEIVEVYKSLHKKRSRKK